MASNYPHGFAHGVAIRNVPIALPFDGNSNIFWVDSGRGSDGNQGTFKQPFATLDYAVGRCTASNGDIIYCAPGHVETVIAAAGLALDVAGVTIIFLGEGTNRAYITFTTAVTADMDVDAANVTMVNPRFIAGIDSLTGPIDVNAADFTIINGEWVDATDVETTDCIIATAGATRMVIDGWKWECGTETADQKQSHIQINGCDSIVLKNIDIRGDFFVGCIENVTDQVLNARFENLNLENLNATPKPALFLNANATGTCKNVKLHVASATTYASSYAKMAWDNQCEGFSGVVSPAGDYLGTAPATGLEGQIIEILSDLETTKSDLIVADALIDTIKSDLIVADALIDTIKSDLIVTNAIVDTVASDTVIVMSDVKVVGSDLIVTNAIVDTIASDMVVTNAIVDTIASDTVVIMSDVKVVGSDLIVTNAIVDSILSDLIVTNAIVDTIASDAVVIMSDVKVVGSDLIVTNAIVDTIYSDTTELTSDMETVKSDLVVADAIIDSILSDLIVTNAIVDTAASDIVVIMSDLKSTLSDLKVLDALFDGHQTKYASDITALMSDLATKT